MLRWLLRTLASAAAGSAAFFAFAPAFALSPSTGLDQYAHRSWRTGDDGLASSPQAVTQSTDGYIWVAASDGVYRFDGVSFTRWRPRDQSDPFAHGARFIYGAPDGSVFVGQPDGLTRIIHDQAIQIRGPFENPGPFSAGPDGSVMFPRLGHHTQQSGFCAVRDNRARCLGRDVGIACDGNLALDSSPDGEVLMAGDLGFCRWRPGHTPVHDPIQPSWVRVNAMAVALARTPDGQLWAGLNRAQPGAGLLVLHDGAWASFKDGGVDGSKLDVLSLLADREGALWIGTFSHGLYRLFNHRLEHFGVEDGLSADLISNIYEDHEGSVWVTTHEGLDQFQDLAALRFTRRQSLQSDKKSAIATTPDGSVWVGSADALERIRGDQIATIKVPAKRQLTDSGFLYGDTQGDVWLAAPQGLSLLEHGRFRDIRDPMGEPIRGGMAFAQTADGDVWIASTDFRQRPFEGLLWRFHEGKVVAKLPSPAETGGRVFVALAGDGGNGLWAAVYRNGVFHVADGVFHRLAGAAPMSNVTGLLADRASGGVWTASADGVALVQGQTARALFRGNQQPCRGATDLMQDRAGDLWIDTACGLVRVAKTDVELWRRHPDRSPPYRLFDAQSGFIHSGSADDVGPLQAADGRLWVSGSAGVRSIDPGHLPHDSFAPPLVIEQVLADHHPIPVVDGAMLPQRSRDIEIDYAGLSYVRPEHISFRYRLVGHDAGWTDAGGRRQAFYNDLQPGTYRFELSACNADGVCSDKPLILPVRLPPAFYQTIVFKLLLAGSLIAAAMVLVQRRLEASRRAVRIRYEERLQERTRVARELHDTLMQTVMASKLIADDARRAVQPSDASAPVLERLSNWLGMAVQEGRASVESLRSTTLGATDLSEALDLALAEEEANSGLLTELTLEGAPGGADPMVLDEVLRIGVEAIRNASQHAKAGRLWVVLTYAEGMTLTVRDDGHGIDPAVLKAGRPGHFGLTGMRERAQRIGGRLSIDSKPGETCVRLELTRGRLAGEGTWGELIKRGLSYILPRFRPGPATPPR